MSIKRIDYKEAREYYYMLIITLQNECDEVYLDECDEEEDGADN